MQPEADYIIELLKQLEFADYSTAFQLLESAIKSNPHDARPVLLLAGQCANAQDYDRAEALYIAAVQLDPNLLIARFQLGLLQFTSGRPIAAMATWAPFEFLPTTHYLRLFSEAFKYLAEDHFQQSCDAFRAGILANTENEPLNRDMNLMLSRILDSEHNPENGKTTNGGEGVQSEESSQVDEASGNPFLLSNYRKQE